MALPFDIELVLVMVLLPDIELPCAKAGPAISIAAAAPRIRIRDMVSSGLRFSQVRRTAPAPGHPKRMFIDITNRKRIPLHAKLRDPHYFADKASVTILPSAG